MGRPCEYDEERALDSAMLVFWQKGFAGTCISDLETAMGMKRQSIYNAFGDKLELYGRVLRRYRDKTQRLVAPLLCKDAGLAELKEHVQKSLGLQREYECSACMVIKAAFDQQIDDPEIRRTATEAAVATRHIYRNVFEQAKCRGEIDEQADTEGLAQYLFSVINGLSALAQTGGSRKDVERSIELTFATLPKGREQQVV